MKRMLILLSACIPLCGTAGDLYQPREFSVDSGVIYSYPVESFDRVLSTSLGHGRWGVTLGGNYFLSEYLGVRADALIRSVDAVDGAFIDAVTLGPVIRLPSNSTGLAPYGRVAASYLPEIERFGLLVGAGLEWRLTEHFGLVGGYDYEFNPDGDWGRVSLLARFRF